MKKLFTIIFLLAGIVKMASAQGPNWIWAKTSTGNPFEYGYGISADNSGHFFLSGRISGNNVSFGGITASAPALNPFEEEFDTAGNGIWFQTQYYSSNNDYPGGFFRDNKNNTYGTGIIGSSTGGMYVEKRNTSGAMVSPWPVIFKGAAPGGFGVVADKQGNVYFVSIDNPGSVTLNNSISVTNTGSGLGTFVAKLDSNGNTIWANSINDASGNVIQRDITTDNKGNIYTLGEYTGSPVFGTISVPASSGYSNFFIAKFDTSGMVLWVATASSASSGALGNPQGSAHAIAVDSCGNLYVTGKIESTATFGGISVSSAGGDDMFVAKCDKSGNWQWVNTAGSSSNDLGYSVALDKFDEVYVGGNAGGNINFGNGVSLAGGSELYVAKYSNSTGQALWAQGGGTGANLEGLDVDNQGYLYIVGDYSGTVTFGSHSITCSNAYSNIFIAKLDTVPPRTIVPQTASAYCPGSNAVIPYVINGTFNNGNTFTAELSDSTGSFVSPVILGDTTSTTSGGIKITIPSNIPTGSNYLIRVVSSNPGTSSYVNGCGAYFANNVYVNTTPVTIGGGSVTAKVSNDTSICSGSFAQLHASGGTSYLWSPAVTLNNSTIANPIAAPTSPQIYTVIVSSGSCGSDTAKVTVNVNLLANISVSPANTTVCAGSPVTLNATGATSYTWTPATGLNCYTCASPVANLSVNTTYSVTGNGGVCSNTFLDTVNVGNLTVGGIVTAVRDTICAGTPGNLTLAGNSSSTIQWQTSPDDISFTNALHDTLVKYKTNPLSQTTWYRAIVGAGNCNATSDTLELYVPPALVASFYSTQMTPNHLTFNSDSSLGKIRSYHWDFGDGGISTDSNPSHTYTKDSTYYVCLTLYDGSNCSYTFCRYSSVTDAIPTISAAGNWLIYPNPFSEQLTVSSKGGNSHVQSIEMYDMLGRLVINQNLAGTTNTSLQLNVSSLAKGMYYIMIRTTDADYVQKVVKQ